MVYQATENVVLIEKYLDGREYCIAVAGPVTARDGKLRRGSEPFTFGALERVLSSDEMIFTSMDVKPITGDRFRTLTRPEDAEIKGKLRQIACEVFLEFNLGSLIRIDLRADMEGNMYILEANPKPDLKNTSKGVTSLVAAGLPEAGMSYDDLILSLFADRLDFLFKHRSASVQHILDLMQPTSIAAPSIVPEAAALRPDRRPASGALRMATG
jgi:D-alanine-D-alanine ligase